MSEFPRALPLGTPSGNGYIWPYIPCLVLIRIEYVSSLLSFGLSLSLLIVVMSFPYYVLACFVLNMGWPVLFLLCAALSCPEYGQTYLFMVLCQTVFFSLYAGLFCPQYVPACLFSLFCWPLCTGLYFPQMSNSLFIMCQFVLSLIFASLSCPSYMPACLSSISDGLSCPQYVPLVLSSFCAGLSFPHYLLACLGHLQCQVLCDISGKLVVCSGENTNVLDDSSYSGYLIVYYSAFCIMGLADCLYMSKNTIWFRRIVACSYPCIKLSLNK